MLRPGRDSPQSKRIQRKARAKAKEKEKKGSWKVLHHATNTRATVCKQQQSGSTEACNMKAEHVKNRTALLFLFRLAGK